jgi:DNA-binding transcriptional ArsR family regulator
MTQQPKIKWDQGSAYDLFISLRIIHRPEEYGLRPSWAAGVRSRLPIHLRDLLERSQTFMGVPLHFIYHLPKPKNAATVIAELEKLAPEERLPALVFNSRSDERTVQFRDFLISLEGKQRLTAGVEDRIQAYYQDSSQLTRGFMRALFESWTNQKEFGEIYLEALKAYVDNFFEEEEPRILPAQNFAVEKYQSRAQTTDLLSLLEDVSKGVRMAWLEDLATVVLAPSFWATPFVFFTRLDNHSGIIVFGARPTSSTLVPGELVPEELLNGLKALANPTRLRILHVLQESPRSTSELAKALRLRLPTMTHHLHNLRLAGLINVTISPNAERQYAIRKDGIDTTTQKLRTFLPGG